MASYAEKDAVEKYLARRKRDVKAKLKEKYKSFRYIHEISNTALNERLLDFQYLKEH